MKVLVVDDEEDSRLLLKDLLTSEGYDTILAEDGQEALEMAALERPDIIVSDILMPSMDGFELCERIKEDPKLCDIAFIFYTATFVDIEDERMALDLGASYFLRKPSDPDEFLALLSSVILEQSSGGLPVPTKPRAEDKELVERHRKRLTNRLYRKSRQYSSTRRAYESLVSNLPGMVYRRQNDIDGTIEFISDRCLSVTGYSTSELVGNHAVTYSQLIHADDRERVQQAVANACSIKGPYQLEYRLRHRDGREIWVWDQGHCISHAGPPSFVEGYVTDITRQRTAESQQHSFFNLSLDLLCIAGMDGYFKQVSPAWTRTLGWSEAEILARPWNELVHPDDRDSTEQARASLQDGSKIYSFTNRFQHKDGGYRWLSWNSMPLPEEGLLYGVARDISDQIDKEQQLERITLALRTLSEGNRALVHASDEQGLLNDMCQAVVDTGGYYSAWVVYLDQGQDLTVKVMADYGFNKDIAVADMIERLYWSSGNPGGELSSCEKAIRSGKTRIALDIQQDPDFMIWRDCARAAGFNSMITMPLITDEQPFGALAICGQNVGGFNTGEISLLQELAGDLSYGISTRRVYRDKVQTETRLEQSLLQAIQAIAMTVEKRDPYTSGHQNRVAELASAIATEMQLPKQQIDGIRLGAMIHDIGKISIPAEILNRPGRLSEHEFGIIKTHPDVGYEIIRDVQFPWPIADMIRQHHEHLDGSGYPQGIKGDEILMEARILAVADVVEAITSHRPYRAALGLEFATEEIMRHKGIWYEPEVVNICVRLIQEDGFKFNSELG